LNRDAVVAYPLRREKWTPTAPSTATTEAVQSKKHKMADPADEGITVTREMEGKYPKQSNGSLSKSNRT